MLVPKFLPQISRFSSSMARSHLRRVNQLPSTNFCNRQCAVFISTSGKKTDTTTVAGVETQVQRGPKTVEDFANPSKKTYQTFGFHHDPDFDICIRNGAMFLTITCILVICSWVHAYLPPNKLMDWTRREAYIELARREALGLPLVDPNLIPPEQVNLPSDEELGDFNIII